MRIRPAENLHLKVISVTMTFMLYFFVISEKEKTREFTLAIEVGQLPAGYALLSELPDVRVAVTGSARGFARLDSEALRVLTLDVRRPDQTRWEIREDDLDLPRHFTIESIEPRWVEIALDRLVEREVVVRPNIRGEPARGYEITETRVEPASVSVSAPASYFPEMDAVFSEWIDISDSNQTVAADVGLLIQRPYVHYAADTQFQVTVEIEAQFETRLLEGVPMHTTGANTERCSLDVASISVRINGPKSLVQAVEPYDIFAAIDCAPFLESGPGLYTPTPIVRNLASPMEVVETEPHVVQLTVSPPPEPPADGSGDLPVPGSNR